MQFHQIFKKGFVLWCIDHYVQNIEIVFDNFYKFCKTAIRYVCFK